MIFLSVVARFLWHATCYFANVPVAKQPELVEEAKMSVLALLGKLLELAASAGRAVPGDQRAPRPVPIPVRNPPRKKK